MRSEGALGPHGVLLKDSIGFVVMLARNLKSIMKQRNSLFGILLILFYIPCCVSSEEITNEDLTTPSSLGLEIITTEFDPASRGNKKFGDKCEETTDCGFKDSICDSKKKSCQCKPEYQATNHIDKCGKEAAINESCFFNEQCEALNFQTECRDGRCICRFEMVPVFNKDGSIECKGKTDTPASVTYVDPAMIGVLVAMAVMFVIICVVLRLFSREHWRENRTIFNTPNPRLMNVSLLRENKHGQDRRGSRMSVRAPSRQPSMSSLRPHSPNASLGKQGSRRGSHGSSNASPSSTKSNRSATNTAVNNQYGANNEDLHHVQAHIINASVLENVTIEMSNSAKA